MFTSRFINRFNEKSSNLQKFKIEKLSIILLETLIRRSTLKMLTERLYNTSSKIRIKGVRV